MSEMSSTSSRWFPLFGVSPKQKINQPPPSMSSATETENTDEEYEETEMEVGPLGLVG